MKSRFAAWVTATALVIFLSFGVSAVEPKPSLELIDGLIEAERFEQALAAIRSMNGKGDLTQAQADLLVGRIYMHLGKPSKALDFFERASMGSIDGEGEALLGSAEARLALGNLSKARHDAESALKSDPDLMTAHLIIARIDQRLGRSDLAVDRISALLRNQPDSEEAAVLHARFTAYNGTPQAAAEELERFVALYPSAAFAHDQLGQFLWASGHSAEALQEKSTAKELYEQHGQAGRAMAMAAWIKSVDPKGAILSKVSPPSLEAPAPDPQPSSAPKLADPEPPKPIANPRPQIEATPIAAPPKPIAPAPVPQHRVQQAVVLTVPEQLPFAQGVMLMTGSGIVLDGGRRIITNRHVIEGMNTIAVRNGTGHVRMAHLIKVGEEDDLALLEIDQPFPEGQSLPLSALVDPAPGRDAVVMGFPLINVLGDEQPALTEGIVAKTMGLSNDVKTFQITAKLNKGNSGGPIFDRRGRLIGVAVGKLDTEDLQRKGVHAEDINIGIKSGRILRFIGKADSSPTEEVQTTYTLEDLYQQMLPRVVLVAAMR